MSTSERRHRDGTISVARAPRPAPARLDEYTTFRQLVDVTGATTHGTWRLQRAVGDLGYAPTVFAQDERTGVIVPMAAIVRLIP